MHLVLNRHQHDFVQDIGFALGFYLFNMKQKTHHYEVKIRFSVCLDFHLVR